MNHIWRAPLKQLCSQVQWHLLHFNGCRKRNPCECVSMWLAHTNMAGSLGEERTYLQNQWETAAVAYNFFKKMEQTKPNASNSPFCLDIRITGLCYPSTKHPMISYKLYNASYVQWVLPYRNINGFVFRMECVMWRLNVMPTFQPAWHSSRGPLH